MSARSAWASVGGVLAVAAIVTSAYDVTTLLARGDTSSEHRFPVEQVRRIDVRSKAGGPGSVTVVDGSGDEVVVTARIEHGLRPTAHRVELNDGVLAIRSSCPNFGSSWCSARYTISVPRGVAGTDGSGTVEVSVVVGDGD